MTSTHENANESAKTCKTCKGKGKIEYFKECGDCEGSGKAWIECPDCNEARKTANGKKCRTCKGKGVVPGDDPCGLCNGEKGFWVTEDCPDC